MGGREESINHGEECQREQLKRSPGYWGEELQIQLHDCETDSCTAQPVLHTALMNPASCSGWEVGAWSFTSPFCPLCPALRTVLLWNATLLAQSKCRLLQLQCLGSRPTVLLAAQGTDVISPAIRVKVHSHSLEPEISPLVIPLLALTTEISPTFRLLP